LLVLDGFLVGRIEPDVRQGRFVQRHAVLGQPRGQRLLNIRLDLPAAD
jgi:hypothetical protein